MPDRKEPKNTGEKAGEIAIMGRALWKTYKTGRVNVDALAGTDIEVRKGEMVVVMGPSGCGKTTLLNCLSGIDVPTSGQVIIDGNDIASMSDSRKTEYRGKKVGFIFQSYNLIPVLTAVENVEMPLLITGIPRAESRRLAMETLKLVGLDGSEHHLPLELSGGQQQRVAIARSLVNRPAIIFADEPTGNLDTDKSKQVMDLLAGLNRKLDQTYIIVTHDERVADYAHRVVHMENGKILRIERRRPGVRKK